MRGIVKLRDVGLPLSTKTLYRLARRGELPGAFRLSERGPWLVDRKVLDAWLKAKGEREEKDALGD